MKTVSIVQYYFKTKHFLEMPSKNNKLSAIHTQISKFDCSVKLKYPVCGFNIQ